MSLRLMIFLLLTSLAGAQQVNPNQIQPGTNSYVLTTVAGVPAWAPGSGTPQYFGAKGDGIIVNSGCGATGSPAVVTCSSTPFNCATDVGKALVITGAGPQFASLKNVYGTEIPTSLVSTIRSCQSTSQVTLAGNASFTVTGQWMAFGTDDSAAVRACVMAGPAVGGRCTVVHGSIYMMSSTTTAISVLGSGNGINGGMIDGDGVFVVAPQGALTAGVNDGLFYISSSLSTLNDIAAPIDKGDTFFTASGSPSLTAGEWVEIEAAKAKVNNAVYIDWAQVASVSGSTVNLIEPTRMVWPAADALGNSLYLGYRTVTNISNGFTLKDFTVFTPMIFDGSRFVRSFIFSATNAAIIDHVTCWNASTACLESNFDRGMKLTNNSFMAEATASELAESVDGVYTGNTFAKKAAPINQNQGPCSVGASVTGINPDLGTGFFTLSGNSIPEACAYGINSLYGVHDGTIANNTIGWLQNPATESIALDLSGNYRMVVTGNTGAGADGSISRFVSSADIGVGSANPAINSDSNVFANNHANEITTDYLGTLYALTGTLGTDCASYQPQGVGQLTSTCAQLIPAGAVIGATGLLQPIQILGALASGVHITFGATGAEQNTLGSLYSSGGFFAAANAAQTTYGVDNWHQTLGSIPSEILTLRNSDGLSIYSAPSSSSDAAFSTFFPNLLFQINPALVTSTINSSLTTTSTIASHTPLTLNNSAVTPTGPLLILQKGGSQVGSIDINGNVKVPMFQSTGTTFTVAGCGTATSVIGGPTAGSFVGGSATCTPVITTGLTAAHGYACRMNDFTTPTALFQQSGTTTTTATFTAAGTVGATDTINFGCEAY